MIQGAELGLMLDLKPQAISNIRQRCELEDGVDSIAAKNNRRYYTPRGIRKILKSRGYDFKRRNISVCNVKGGVGKTTISVNLARKFSSLGFKTLLIDLDKQGNATTQLWPEAARIDFPCLYDIIDEKAELNSSIVEINEYLSVLPSNLKNQLLEGKISEKRINQGTYFSRILNELEYDIVVFDTAPDLSQISTMALAYSDLNIAPIKLDKNSIDGLEFLLQFIKAQSKEWPEMKLETKVLINGFDKRMLTESLKKISEVQSLGVETFETAIRTDNSFVKAQENYEIKKSTKAYEDLSFLANELLGLGNSGRALQ